MCKRLSWFSFALAIFGAGALPALAGQGDSAAHIKAQNAICDAQKRGEIPRNPDMCLPSLPPDDYHEPRPRR